MSTPEGLPESLGKQLFPNTAALLLQTSIELRQALEVGHYATAIVVGAFGLALTGASGIADSLTLLPKLVGKGIQAIDAWGERQKIGT